MGGRGPMPMGGPRSDPPPRAFPPMDDPGWGPAVGRGRGGRGGRGPPMRGGGRGPPPGCLKADGPSKVAAGGRGNLGGRGQKRKMAGGY